MVSGVALAAATAGVVLGPLLLEKGLEGERALAQARFLDLAGRPRRLSEWAGKVVILNFWATWCAPCREEIPMFIQASAQYSKFGVEFVGIGIDRVDKMSEFSRNTGIPYPILVGDSGTMDLMKKLGNFAAGLPFTVVLDRGGKPRNRKLGQLDRTELDGWLSELGIPEGDRKPG